MAQSGERQKSDEKLSDENTLIPKKVTVLIESLALSLYLAPTLYSLKGSCAYRVSGSEPLPIPHPVSWEGLRNTKKTVAVLIESLALSLCLAPIAAIPIW